jgi:dolichol-phosphate mannosyltransferase
MISVVLPTYNERENIGRIIREIFAACDAAGLEAEVIVADDLSPDGTADAAEEALAGRKGKVLRRSGVPRGLAPAVVDGFAAAGGDICGVMDADLSHPPEAVPRLVEALAVRGADLAVGSRYVPDGGIEGWPFRRRFASKVACLLARPVTSVRDATSGFFFLKKTVLDGVRLSPRGFKIGLEVFVKGRYGSREEVPYVFTDRTHGESKLSGGVITHFLMQVARLLLWRVFVGRRSYRL